MANNDNNNPNSAQKYQMKLNFPTSRAPAQR